MSSILRSTGIVALSTFASRILGFIRDMLMAFFFGATGATDAFFVAFKIPNLFRRFVAEGSLTISFIPVYTDYLINRGEDEARELAQKTLSILLVVLVALVLLGEYFSPEIVKVFAIGFTDPHTIDLAVLLNRIMFPYLFFVSLVAFAMGVLNSHRYFFAPAIAPALLNVGIISGILVLSGYFPEPLMGASVGVLVGGVMQVVLQVPYMMKAGFRMKISIDLKHPGIRKIFSMLGPAVFGMAVYQINSLIITILASYLESGSISYLYYSDRLTELVLGVFIVSIGNVILPEMSQLTASDDYDRLKSIYVKSLRGALFLAVPASFALMGLGMPIISTIFMHNNFSAHDSEMTYLALFYASLGISSVSILRLTTPTFYSLKDTKTPVRGATLALVLNMALGAVLMRTGLRHAGLTLALSLSTTIQVVYLVAMLRRKIGRIGLTVLFRSVGKMAVASAVMTGVCLAISWQLDWTSASTLMRVMVLSAAIIAGGSTYAGVCYLLGVDEVLYVVNRIRGGKGRS